MAEGYDNYDDHEDDFDDLNDDDDICLVLCSPVKSIEA